MLSSLPDHARVWIYPSERPFSAAEKVAVIKHASEFAQRWVAHSHQLTAATEVLEDRFLVLAVDESQAGASGCSIDSSVRFVQQLGAEMGVDFFNRMLFSYRTDSGEVMTVGRPDFKAHYASEAIKDDTIVFDPLVKTIGELKESFEKKLSESWHRRMV